MDTRYRIDPAEEARHREVMDAHGVYDADWALSKVLENSDVQTAQNRLLLTKEAVRASPIPKLFPELEERRADGLNAEHKVSATAINADGHENGVQLRYLNSNRAYRVMGGQWRLFVKESGISQGDRLDLYTCRRGDGERCLFFFRTIDWDASAPWCTNVGRKRARQPAAAAVRDLVAEDDEEFFLANGGRAGGNNGKHRGDVDYTRAKRDRGRDRKRREKNGSRSRREDRMLLVTEEDVHDAWCDDFEGDYARYKAERPREDIAPWHLDVTPEEREAAQGLLMLRHAIYAEQHY